LISIILTVLYIVSCFILILFVLLQPGKSDAAAVFGGGANSSAFGPRGTQTVLAKVTIGAAVIFFLIAFLFAIPGLFDERSQGESLGPAEVQQTAPEPPAAPVEQAVPPATPQTAPATQPAATETKPAEGKQDKKEAPKKP
jgi:preprotein translocase subunit SecG